MTLVTKALVWQAAVWVLAILTLFLPAGTFAWPAGWVFFVIFFGFVLFLSIYLLRKNSSLLEERLTILRRNQPLWDKVWLLLFYMLSLVWFIIMPLDAVRLRWSQMPLFLQGVGVLLLIISLMLIFLVVRFNSYLSPTVRIQKDREQTVISEGPYHYVRHPLYGTAFLFHVCVPLLFGSWLGEILVPVFIGMLVLRSILEEQVLREELPGYDTYMRTIKYRFIPRVW